ncbi:hypothetical protein [Actinomadura sp. SCN-SB]|uniref:hypothetical protein n=1 Tax=Actinomadura sp. SCN-SB TaxID=3373092 RepID=UPI0037511355
MRPLSETGSALARHRRTPGKTIIQVADAYEARAHHRPGGADVIAAASRHCDRLGVSFGTGSREYQEAVSSWQRSFSRLFAMGLGAQTHVTCDGALSLLVCSGSGLVYAIVFHPVQRGWRPGRLQGSDQRRRLDAPHPGIWLFHP